MDPVQTIREALESADATVWDKHYGKGLSVEYARRVHVELRAALASLDAIQEERKRLREAVRTVAGVPRWRGHLRPGA